MKKIILIFAFFIAIAAVKAQPFENELKFSRILTVVGTTPQTVPADAVWKVTSVSGAEVRVNQCINGSIGSTHEIGEKLQCGVQCNTLSVRASYIIRSLVVNSISLPVSITGFGNLDRYCSSTNCTGSNSLTNFSCSNLETDPNALPLWLGANSTLATGGPNTIATVIEFKVVQ